MNTYYITFGSDHLLGFGLHYYVKVIAPNEILVRMRIHQLTNGKWCGTYTDWKPKHGERCLGTIIIHDKFSWECFSERREQEQVKNHVESEGGQVIMNPAEAIRERERRKRTNA